MRISVEGTDGTQVRDVIQRLGVLYPHVSVTVQDEALVLDASSAEQAEIRLAANDLLVRARYEARTERLRTLLYERLLR